MRKSLLLSKSPHHILKVSFDLCLFINAVTICLYIFFDTLPIVIGNLSVKVDGKSNDQKPNTPRSKHSATEQRRRSKINDRHVYHISEREN